MEFSTDAYKTSAKGKRYCISTEEASLNCCGKNDSEIRKASWPSDGSELDLDQSE